MYIGACMKDKMHGFVGSDFADAVVASSSQPAAPSPTRREEPPRPLGQPSLSTADLANRTGNDVGRSAFFGTADHGSAVDIAKAMSQPDSVSVEVVGIPRIYSNDPQFRHKK